MSQSIITPNYIGVKFVPSTLICAIGGSIFINIDRNLFSIGKSDKGYLGHFMDVLMSSPKQIPNLKEIKIVDCGYYHTVCIDYEGNLFTFGSNDKGQLGIGKDKNEIPFTHIPQQVNSIPPINSISCGFDFTTCITNDGIVYSFGDNYYDQLGIGNEESSYSSPQLINDLNDIEIIQCGAYHTICKTNSKEYYSWGDNEDGQLGQGNNESCNKPNKCLNWPEDIIDIKCGDGHTLLLTSTGYVYSFGSNTDTLGNPIGQLGLNRSNLESIDIPTLIKDIPLIKRIECGNDHSICIDVHDKLWVFGENDCGQLGLGDRENRLKPILNKSLHDIIDISTGGYHTFAKTINNEIYAFGKNGVAQLGIEALSENQLTPVRVFKDNEDIWTSNFRSKQKSARK